MKHPLPFFGAALLGAAILLSAGCCSSDEAKAPVVETPKPADPAAEIRLTASIAGDNFIFQRGETIRFRVSCLAGDEPALRTIRYNLSGDGGFSQSGDVVTENGAAEVPAHLDYPGWLNIRFTLLDGEGKTTQKTAAIGALIEPEKLAPAKPEPADFDAFWASVRAELAKVPMTATREPAKPMVKSVETYDVKVTCPGAMPVSGYLSMPVDKSRRYPAIAVYHGAGVRSSHRPDQIAAKGAIVFNVNAHGIENGHDAAYYREIDQTTLKDYRLRNADSREKIYFHDMYLRVLRSLEYLRSLPEWNGKDLIVVGGSQGGAQTIFAAANDPAVTLAAAGVPALCDHAGVLSIPARQSGWPRFYKAAEPGVPADPVVASQVAYYDGVFFARRITCETFFSTGLCDTTCVPTSVYTAYNNLPEATKKTIEINPRGTHSTSKNPKAWARIDEILNNAR